MVPKPSRLTTRSPPIRNWPDLAAGSDCQSIFAGVVVTCITSLIGCGFYIYLDVMSSGASWTLGKSLGGEALAVWLAARGRSRIQSRLMGARLAIYFPV